MPFSPELAEIRFGCGLSPLLSPAPSAQMMLDGVKGADVMAGQFPIETYEVFSRRMVQAQSLRKKMRKARGSPEFNVIKKQRNLLKKAARRDMSHWLGRHLLRWTYTEQGFRERLATFWADHFTARGKNGLLRQATSPFIEDAIRPHIGGRFAEILVAATTHPLMLNYLDQEKSIGPNSYLARRVSRKVGINENLAREVLELHTLGVDGPYVQQDVRQLAELFTGLTSQVAKGFGFRKDFAEPGAESILGKSYGGDLGRLGPVIEAFDDLAVHPATAQHIAWKLAVHFVSDTPDPALVDHVAARFLDTDGDLMAVYAALLEHPAAWDETLHNAKPPAAFVGSSFRALAMPVNAIETLTEKAMRRNLTTPMTLMGQSWQRPTGPDGWPEEDEAWITPQGVAARLRWAVAVPQVLLAELPDPRQFVNDALGVRVTETLRFVASSAESKSIAIGLVLASPEFQRR